MSNVTVSSNGALGGTGTISGSVQVNSGTTLFPGASPGILNTGNVTLNSGSTFAVEITGVTVGAQYDQLNVTGTVSLGGATLTPSFGVFVPAPGNVFTIINNDDIDGIPDTFNGLVEGATVTTINGNAVRISYAGGDGNDVTLYVNPNSAPVLDNTGSPSLEAIAEDAVSNSGTLVSAILASGAGGDPISDADAGSPEGIAVTAVDNTSGSWQFSTDNGTNWTAFGSSEITNVRLLASAANTRIRLVPSANFNGTIDAGITFRAWDQTSGTNGGTADVTTSGGNTAFSSASETETASITVTVVNDAPTATDDSLSSIAEDSGNRTISFASLTGNDDTGPANESGQSLTITSVGTAVGGSVSIVGTNVIFAPTLNFNGAASFDYTVQDNGTTNGVADFKTDVGSVSFTITPTDSDGVTDAVEDAAPNGGDGNNDGVLDSQQSNVTSLPSSAAGTPYVTVASPSGTSLADVAAVANPSPGDAPPGAKFPVGFLDFTVAGITPAGAATTVTLYLPDDTKVSSFYKYGPEPGNATPHWYNFSYDGTTGAEIFAGQDSDSDPELIILYFVDGQRGDDDLLANGLVVDPGAPVFFETGPTADLSNNGPVSEGTTATASFSNQSGVGFHYSYDFNNDGTFEVGNGTYAGSVSTDSATVLASYLDDGPGSREVAARIIDQNDRFTDYTTIITINNVAPTAGIGPADAALNQSQTFTLTATDPSTADQLAGFLFTINWGDGTAVDTVSGLSGTTANHTYSQIGVYTVSVTAKDKDNDTGAATTTSVTVAGVHLIIDPCAPKKLALLVGGTSLADYIQLKPVKGSTKIEVFINTVSKGSFNPTGSVIVCGQAGNDTITVDSTISRRSSLYGNAGNDTITTGNGPSIVVGGDDNDMLTGGNNRDILIGGNGADTLNGGNGDDILIAGTTSFDAKTTANQQALCKILDEWLTGLTYTTRINHLRGTTSGGLNGASWLIVAPGPSRTVFDDASVDSLTGGMGLDWYFANTVPVPPPPSAAIDLLFGKVSTELLEEL